MTVGHSLGLLYKVEFLEGDLSCVFHCGVEFDKRNLFTVFTCVASQ